MGHGDTCCEWSRERRTQSGNDDARHADVAKREDLFSSAPKDEGIAALEPHDGLEATGEIGEKCVDLALARGVPRILADVHDLRARVHESHDRLVDQSVAHDDVGVAENSRSAYRQELGRTRPGGHQGDRHVSPTRVTKSPKGSSASPSFDHLSKSGPRMSGMSSSFTFSRYNVASRLPRVPPPR